MASHLKSADEHAALLDLIRKTDEHISGITLPADQRSQLASGCLHIALEHQAAIALLYSSELFGSAFAFLRVLSESLVRGLWLLNCATDAELEKFKKGRIGKTFAELIEEIEGKIGIQGGVLSRFKDIAWNAMNGFTHTGFIQVTRRHTPGIVQANYPEDEIVWLLQAAGKLGEIAAAQLIAMSQTVKNASTSS